MVYLTAEENWLVQDLARFVEPVEIHDLDGKILGVFVPANLERGQQLYADLHKKVDWQEVERHAQSPERGHTTKEVLEALEKLPIPSSAPSSSRKD